MKKMTGTAASSGFAVGNVYLYRPFVPEIPTESLQSSQIPEAISCLERARVSAVAEIEQLIAEFSRGNTSEADIFRAHMELLEDEDVWSEVLEAVSDGNNPAAALDVVFSQYIHLMGANDDAMMQERVADLKDVRNRLLRNLIGLPERNLSHLPGPVVVVAHDLLPADTATMDRSNVLAIITEIGGQTSHSAIIARSYKIPAVLGVPDVLSVLTDGETVAVDGFDGEIVIRPDSEICAAFEMRRSACLAQDALVARYLFAPCRTLDGTAIEIGANIGADFASGMALSECVDFVGLFRTEFLYMQSDRLPTEEQQYATYSGLLRAYGDKPVVLRTLDIGGDKALPCLPLPREDNPFLGKRALRLCLERTDLFVTQLRAALRASVFGKLWIMFPMVATPDDWRRAKALAQKVMDELRAEGIPVASDVKFGIMIEIPSIVILADQIVKEVDFASIGTNDLCQYTLAVDRGNPDLSGYYQPFSPAVFRMIAHVVRIFRQAEKPICVCGEMGGDVAASLVLVGLGLRKLSMSGSAIATVKHALAGKSMEQLEIIAENILSMATATEAENYLKSQI